MKYKQLALSVAVLTALSGCQTSSDTSDKPEKTNHLSQGVYEVEYGSAQALAAQSKTLSQVMSFYCASNTDIEAVKQTWHETMVRWMALQGQERGPEEALAQSWNIQFWPDKKNTTGRKMSALIRQDQSATQEDIAQQSVTVQGLGSIEWLLYDKGSDLIDNAQTCSTATSITTNIELNTASIAQAWSTNPWVELDEKRWESEYIALLSNQLEYSMKKMSRPLANFGKPRPYFSESWRSETSMQNLKANVEAMQALYFANGQGLDALLREKGKAELADRIANQFAMTVETWPAEQSLFSMLQTKPGYQYAYSQYNKLEQLKYLIHEEVAIELGVIIGFNATDGD
ncbi:iron-regulated protein A [Vibrio aquaticus]|uniref:Iron-regulated protein A n=1 Tax=Vibrio aquaticus TaxID=2496559 RepID=A0A3S0V3R8_9VIBR|nr:imelysin family protein [Vibrio aquaticus]RTZ16690.1 iron-regulated protein A [Vibrio aquaticus]